VDGGFGRPEALRRGQRLVLDLDEVARVLACVTALGDDHGHRLADEAHSFVGQRGEVVTPELRMGRHDGQSLRREAEITNGHDVHHGRVLASARKVHAHDARMRMRAPQQHRVQHAGQRDVAHVAPPPREQPWILLAPVPIPDKLHGEGPGRAPELLMSGPVRESAVTPA
jgi:hypothetical protein